MDGVEHIVDYLNVVTGPIVDATGSDIDVVAADLLKHSRQFNIAAPLVREKGAASAHVVSMLSY